MTAAARAGTIAVVAGSAGPRDVALAAELARVEAMLAAALAGQPSTAASDATAHAGLARLAACFALTPVEREVVLVALAVEISAPLARQMDRLTGRTDGRPTVGALMALLSPPGASPDPVLVALTPAEQLVRHGLIELGGDQVAWARPVRLPDVVWQRLLDLTVELPFPLVPRAMTSFDHALLAPATRAAAEQAIARAAGGFAQALLVVLGDADSAAEALAAAIAGQLGLSSLMVPAAALDDDRRRRDATRDATWLGAALVIQGAPSATGLARAAVAVGVPIIIVCDRPLPFDLGTIPGRWRIEMEVDALPSDLRLACWRRHLGDVATASELDLVAVATQHRIGAARIAALAGALRELAATHGRPLGPDDLRAIMRHGVARGAGLVQRLEGDQRLDDVIVPPATRRELELACAWARHGAAALAADAAGPPLRHHGGLVGLFYGPPGTGKTLAARAIAGELGVDLLRIDLSQVVNKYIGETEKNLDRVFVEAEASGALLFFDEADALFGKRTEVKDAHDRYANIETAFLLQRLEEHRGVCILASNLRQNLDEAFSRRIQIMAEFPLPGVDDRVRIWARHLLIDRLAPDVDLPDVARRFALAGGDIRNAAATALVLATADGVAVGIRHVIVGVWREIKKSGRLVSAEDFGPWRDLILAMDHRG